MLEKNPLHIVGFMAEYLKSDFLQLQAFENL